MEHCRGGDLFKTLMMKGGSLDEHWVCTEVRNGPWIKMWGYTIFLLEDLVAGIITDGERGRLPVHLS